MKLDNRVGIYVFGGPMEHNNKNVNPLKNSFHSSGDVRESEKPQVCPLWRGNYVDIIFCMVCGSWILEAKKPRTTRGQAQK